MPSTSINVEVLLLLRPWGLDGEAVEEGKKTNRHFKVISAGRVAQRGAGGWGAGASAKTILGWNLCETEDFVSVCLFSQLVT